MRKLLLLIILLSMSSCFNKRDFPDEQNIKELSNTSFCYTSTQKITSEQNYIYTPTLLYAWNHFKQETNSGLQKGDILLAKNIDKEINYKNTLAKNEYINDISIEDSILKITSLFQKSLPFRYKFSKNNIDLTFNNNTKVASFGSLHSNEKANKQIKVVHYKNKKEFAIKIIPEDVSNEIFLYQPEQSKTSLEAYYKDLEKHITKVDSNNWKYQFLGNDIFEAPILEFNLTENIKDLIGTQFTSTTSHFIIDEVIQQTALLFDEQGAEIKSKTVIALVKEAANIFEEVKKPEPKRLVFDKPFLLVFKKKDKEKPYFLAWIQNTELMRKIEE